MAAVINAIKSAATTAKHSVHKTNNGAGLVKIGCHANGDDESDSTEMLDSETEPCLMMEHVLEDVSMPDSHSHNLVSSGGMISVSQQHQLSSTAAPSIAERAALPVDMDKEEASLFNLSQAIANRQKIELQANRIIR